VPDPVEKAASRARDVTAWYRAAAREFLAEHIPEQVAPLDDDDARINAALSERDETAICLVGASGIGKSRLLNAIVAQDKTIVPSGGVGPLTALATVIRHSEAPHLLAEYHPRKHLWRVASALSFQIARDRKLPNAERVLDPEELGPDEKEETKEDVAAATEQDAPGTPSRMDEFVRTARLMVAGSQDAQRPIEYLADALSVVCGVKPHWGTDPRMEDAHRIARLKRAVQMTAAGTVLRQEQGADPKAFRELLRDHAAGFLSPLIRRIEVGWPSPVLKDGLVLVDLPGVGVAGDVYKKETQRFVRELARAIVVVVDRSGVTEAVMDLLRSTGYWDKLVLSSDDPQADPCALILVVTRVDDVASQDWRDLAEDENGRKSKARHVVFDEVRERMRHSMRQALEQQLELFMETTGSESIREGRKIAGRAIMESLRIHPVSAIEFRKLIADNDEDRAFLKGTDQSGIPLLSSDLSDLSRMQRARRSERLQRLVSRFAESIDGHLGAIESSWRSNRAAEEAERIRAALQKVLDEKQEEFTIRRASFRTFLGKTVPAKIDVAVHEAKDEAQRGISKYLKSLQDAHWSTLRAAVRRGGTFDGARHIDLPADIALRFQDPVAAVWSQSLLKEIRQETYGLAKDTRQMIEEVCDCATREANAFVDPKVIETQKKLASTQVERLREVGKEAIEELREVVKVKVAEAIEKPIRSACRKFVNEQHDVGTGTKYRILELFHQLATETADLASVPASATLKTNYESVEKEIRRAFKEWSDPIGSVANAIVERHEDRARRSDSQKRAKVLAALDSVRSSLPRGANAGVEMTESSVQ
jgi:GTP-binding protein EngB required for normal cell division